MYKAKLTRLESSHEELRTPYIIGEMSDSPKVGWPIIITNDEPLTKGNDARIVFTSDIKEIHQETDSEYYIKTQNSTYKLEILS